MSRRLAAVGLSALTLTGLLVVRAQPAGALPQLQFPWPSGPSGSPTHRINSGGSTYNCDLHTGAGTTTGNLGGWDKYGIDFQFATGDDVAAVSDGVIEDFEDQDVGALGRYVVIDHGGYFSLYAHLSAVTNETIGYRLRGGEKLGDAGTSGGVPAHLHFVLGKGTDLEIVDAQKPEPMTGINGTTFVGVTAFSQWGDSDCEDDNGQNDGSGNSAYWKSSHSLGDAVLYANQTPLGNESVLKADGYGAFSRTSSTWGNEWTVLIPGHFNDDAHMDIWRWTKNPSNPKSQVMFSNGAGGWTGGGQVNFSTAWDFIYPGDFNDDDRTDLWLYSGEAGDTFVTFSNGSGGWQTQSAVNFSGGWTAYPGHYNADNRTDLFLYKPSSTTGIVELANGSGGWTAVSTNFASGYEVYPGHYDIDRYTDLVLIVDNGVTASYWVRFSNGAGGWVTRTDPPVNTLPAGRAKFVGYFDGDPASATIALKRADLLLYSATTGLYSVRFSDGNGALGGTESGTWDLSDELHPIFENADALTDIVRYNGTRIQVLFRQADGTGWTGGVQDTCCPSYDVSAGYFDSV